MRRSFVVSILVHLGVVALLVVLSRLGPELPAEEAPITVEIVSEAAPPAPSPLPPKPAPAEAAPVPQRQAAAPPPPPPAPKAEVTPKPALPPAPPPPVAAKPAPAEPPSPPAPEPPPKQEAVPKVEPPPKPQPRKPEPEPKKAVAAKPPPPPPPAPKKPEPEKPREAAKVPPKPEKPPAPAPAKAAAQDFDALLRSVEAQSKRVQAPEKRAGKGTAAEAGGTAQSGRAEAAPINPSVLVASISRQITPCWNIPIAAQGIGGLRAELEISLGPDGSVQTVAPTDLGRMSSDPVFRAFAESAVRAVRACSPLKLPPESYQVWRNVIFNFDPSMMAG